MSKRARAGWAGLVGNGGSGARQTSHFGQRWCALSGYCTAVRGCTAPRTEDKRAVMPLGSWHSSVAYTYSYDSVCYTTLVPGIRTYVPTGDGKKTGICSPYDWYRRRMWYSSTPPRPREAVRYFPSSQRYCLVEVNCFLYLSASHMFARVHTRYTHSSLVFRGTCTCTACTIVK